jgi:hypothetical protein
VSRVKIAVLAIVAVAVAGLVIGFIHLQANLNTYGQRYTDCMEVKKSWLPPIYRLDFQSPAYQQMMADCQRQASN